MNWDIEITKEVKPAEPPKTEPTRRPVQAWDVMAISLIVGFGLALIFLLMGVMIHSINK